ncbi:DUF3373 domain-containing protein [Geobacter benzoatilyticus]|uniref:DUF3373 family protein n=1 Tax=Geobacter benzoatilyticus TaxID=2815309 RepID=A0ABX7Q277_9BACT|nr:DUF3373 domain-containing protein [Geobacter benzoatilyticus]QSV45521.1 DUF3373 family protein [Geobacter benzoatilyticus]
MKSTTRKVLAGALLVGLCQPITALAADQADLEKKMEALEKELESLKGQMKDTDRKVDKVEEKSIGRWLTISGDYRFRYDYLQGRTAKYLVPNPADPMNPFPSASKSVKDSSLFTNRFGLNLKAKATQNVSVTARLLMYKVTGDQDDAALQGNSAYSFDRAGAFDGTVGHVPGDSKLAVDRVYATWSNIMDQPIWFSVGRRPSTGGIPSHLKQNQERPGNAGVPQLLVDYAFDGGTLGWAPDIEALPGAYAKICYGRGFESGIQDSSNNSLKDTDMIGINIVPYDTDAFHAEFQYNRGMDIFDAPVMLTGPYTYLKPTANLGDIDWYGLSFLGKVKNAGPGSFHWFVNGAISKTHPNGDLLGIDGNGDGQVDQNMPVALLSDMGDTKSTSGWAVYVGGRYDFESTGTKIGLEYNHGSKNWITFAPAADDMWTSKVGTRGDVYEAYVIQELKFAPISSYLSKVFFKLGYQYYKFDYTGSNSWLGAAHEFNELNNPMLAQMTAPMKTAQDLYATFEVHF